MPSATHREKGGEIRTNADAVSLLRDSNGTAPRVKLADGTRIDARSGVICSVTPNQLYRACSSRLDVAGHRSRQRCKAYRYGKGNFQLHYALKSPPRWMTPGLEKVALLHLTPGLDGVSKAANEAERGMLPEMPTICVGQPHALDPSRCPEGAAILWLQLPEAPRHIKGDAAGKIDVPADGQWTEAVREAYADRIEAILWSISTICRDHQSPARPIRRRSRSDEHQSRRRRSLWRLLRPRPVLPVAAVQIDGQPPDPCSATLSYWRVNPSGPRPRRRLGLHAGECVRLSE